MGLGASVALPSVRGVTPYIPHQVTTSVLCYHWYMGTSLIRNRAPLGPCSRTMPRAL